MATTRRFQPNDLLRFNAVNVDNLTETVRFLTLLFLGVLICTDAFYCLLCRDNIGLLRFVSAQPFLTT